MSKIVFIIGFVFSILAAVLVYIGEMYSWNGFSPRTGYFGAHYLDSMLYSIGSPAAIHVVAVAWFLYLFLPSLIMLFILSAGESRSDHPE